MKMSSQIMDPMAFGDRTSSLSQMELTIVEALSRGLQSKEIATEVGRSPATVETYIRLLYAKLDARSRAQVVARAFVMGLLDRQSGRAAWKAEPAWR